MANGIQCKNCGWYETDHDKYLVEDFGEDAKKIMPGRKYSLKNCPRFEYIPEEEKKAFALLKQEEEIADLEACGRRPIEL